MYALGAAILFSTVPMLVHKARSILLLVLLIAAGVYVVQYFWKSIKDTIPKECLGGRNES